jgi:hypothetical protein
MSLWFVVALIAGWVVFSAALLIVLSMASSRFHRKTMPEYEKFEKREEYFQPLPEQKQKETAVTLPAQ